MLAVEKLLFARDIRVEATAPSEASSLLPAQPMNWVVILELPGHFLAK